MNETIIVLVSDEDDSKHGEISILDDPQKAERLVEALLEAGLDESRIRVFNGTSSEFQISHRPVVALVDGSSEGMRRSPEESKSREGKAEEPAADVAVTQSPNQEPPDDEMTEEEEAPASAEVADTVRFSSLFRNT